MMRTQWDFTFLRVPPSASLAKVSGFRCCVVLGFQNVAMQTRYIPVGCGSSFVLSVAPAPNAPAGQMLIRLDFPAAGRHVEVVHAMESKTFHRIDFGHDGLLTGWIAVDGKVVAESKDITGPLQPIGDQEIIIGSRDPYPPGWKGYADAYEVAITDIWLWHVRPRPPVDPKCLDADALAEVASGLRRRGHDGSSLSLMRHEIDKVLITQFGRLDATRRDQFKDAAPAFIEAYRRHDWHAVQEEARRLQEIASTPATHAGRAGTSSPSNGLLAVLARSLWPWLVALTCLLLGTALLVYGNTSGTAWLIVIGFLLIVLGLLLLLVLLLWHRGGARQAKSRRGSEESGTSPESSAHAAPGDDVEEPMDALRRILGPLVDDERWLRAAAKLLCLPVEPPPTGDEEEPAAFAEELDGDAGPGYPPATAPSKEET